MSKSHRCVSVIYCDDVRLEVGGKLSLIGVYQNKLIAQQLPIVLPKLCVFVKVTTPVDQPFEKLDVVLLRDEEELQRLQVDDVAEGQESARGKSVIGSDDGEERVFQNLFVLTLTSFKVEEDCTLKLRVETEDGVIKGTSLEIQQGEI